MLKFNFRKTIFLLSLRIYGSSIPKYLGLAEKWDKLTADELKKIQIYKLKKLLLHSYRNNPYFREILKDKKVVIGGKVNLNNFSKIPILTKDIIRKKGKALYSENVKRKAFLNTSGGTTGEPVNILQDSNYMDWNFTNKILVNEKLGKELGYKEIKLWGSERDIFNEKKSIKDRFINFIYNRKILNSFRMTENDMESYIEEINSFKPFSIWSYVNSIFELSRYIDKNNKKVFSPKFIMTTAGVLTSEVRDYVEKVFKTKVIDQYGSREVGIIASEDLSQNGLNIFPWSHYIEEINGKIVITVLDNFSMPLIRYELGDFVEFKKSKGKTIIKKIKGRQTDHFILKDGTIIHGEYFTHLFYFRDWVKKFRVEQEKFDEVICKIILLNGKKAKSKDKKDIEKKIRLVMGKECKIKWVFLKNLKNSNSGKFVYTFNKLGIIN